MTKETKHTPAPWYSDEDGRIRSEDGDWIVAMIDDGGHPEQTLIDQETQEANADHIVLCVNTHDALVGALEHAYTHATVTLLTKTLFPGTDRFGDAEATRDVLRVIEKALAAAGVKVGE